MKAQRTLTRKELEYIILQLKDIIDDPLSRNELTHNVIHEVYDRMLEYQETYKKKFGKYYYPKQNI